MLKEDQSQSVVNLLCNQMRREILSGLFQPETDLFTADLQQDFAGSAQDITQALQQLSKEGIIIALTPEHFRVVKPQTTDTTNLLESRCKTECEALEQAIEKGNIHWLTSIVAAQKSLLDTLALAQSNFELYESSLEASNKLFHQSLFSACSYELQEKQRKLYQQSLRFRVSKLRETQQDLTGIIDITNELVAALTQRDKVIAKQLLTKFIMFS